MLAGAASDDPETLGLMRGVPRVEGTVVDPGSREARGDLCGGVLDSIVVGSSVV
jgi:hypothetical protein